MAVSTKARSPALRDQLEDLAALPDDRIDTDEIPESPAEAWQHGRRPGLDRPIKTPIALRLDADIVTWLKDHAQDRGYQTQINRVLRRYVTDREARA